MINPTSTGFAPVNGLELYYEIYGEGQPLVMLHGGVNPAELFGTPLVEMAKTHQVIAVHLQGHGMTQDIDRPMSYEAMADDVAALLTHLDIKQASFMGYSIGGGVALQVAIRYPDVIEKLIVISMPFSQKGDYPEVIANFEQMPKNAAMIAGNIRQSPLATIYPNVDWEKLFTKIGEMNSMPNDWSKDIPRIKAQTLLIFADADMVYPEHIAEFYKLLGGGQRDAAQDGSGRSPNRLAIVPNTTHYNILVSDTVTRFATEFLQ